MARTRKPEIAPGSGADGPRSSASEVVPSGEFLLYQTEDGRARVECRFEHDTLWLSQALIASLFQVAVPTVSEHLKGVFAEGELAPEATVRKLRTVRTEGDRRVARLIDHYSLDAILAVGYRVRSPRGTQFRQWATARLGEFLVKGFALDDERLKHPPAPGSATPDYFDELLERIRDIRASEARMSLRVREIFALAADYVRISRPWRMRLPEESTLRPLTSIGGSTWCCRRAPPMRPPSRSPPPRRRSRTRASALLGLSPAGT